MSVFGLYDMWLLNAGYKQYRNCLYPTLSSHMSLQVVMLCERVTVIDKFYGIEYYKHNYILLAETVFPDLCVKID